MEAAAPEPGPPEPGAAGEGGSPSPSEHAFSGLIGEDGSFEDGWLDKLPDDKFADYKSTLSNMTSLDGMAKALVDNMKAARDKNEGMVKVPGENATQDEVAEFRKTLGVPSEASEYGISRPEGMPEDSWNDEDAKLLGESLIKHGAPKDLASDLLVLDAKRQERAAQQAKDELILDQQKIKSIYGDKLESKKYQVHSLLSDLKTKFGIENLSADHPAMTHPEVFQAFAEIAGVLGGSKASGFSSVSNAPSSNQERAEAIIGNRADGSSDAQIARDYHGGDSAARKKANEFVTSLLG